MSKALNVAANLSIVGGTAIVFVKIYEWLWTKLEDRKFQKSCPNSHKLNELMSDAEKIFDELLTILKIESMEELITAKQVIAHLLARVWRTMEIDSTMGLETHALNYRLDVINRGLGMILADMSKLGTDYQWEYIKTSAGQLPTSVVYNVTSTIMALESNYGLIWKWSDNPTPVDFNKRGPGDPDLFTNPSEG